MLSFELVVVFAGGELGQEALDGRGQVRLDEAHHENDSDDAKSEHAVGFELTHNEDSLGVDGRMGGCSGIRRGGLTGVIITVYATVSQTDQPRQITNQRHSPLVCVLIGENLKAGNRSGASVTWQKGPPPGRRWW